MSEKLFLISEIVLDPCPDMERNDQGWQHYSLPDGTGYLWLPDDAVIPASRLRTAYPKPGERVFSPIEGWIEWTMDLIPGDCLILDPPAPADEWEKWVEEMPDAIPDMRECGRLMKEWFRRMPRGK